MVKKNSNTKKVAALGTAALVLTGVAGGLVGANLYPVTEIVEKPTINQTAIDTAVEEALANVSPIVEIREVEVEKEIIKNVTVEVEKEVVVDSGNLELVLNHIYDNDGDIDYLTEDLDDDEIDQIVDRIVFINEARTLAVREVENKLFDELDNEDFNTTIKFTNDRDDDNYLEKLKIDDDTEDGDLAITSHDFEDKGDYEVTVDVTGTFRRDDAEEFEYLVTVEVEEDGSADIDTIKVRKEGETSWTTL